MPYDSQIAPRLTPSSPVKPRQTGLMEHAPRKATSRPTEQPSQNSPARSMSRGSPDQLPPCNPHQQSPASPSRGHTAFVPAEQLRKCLNVYENEQAGAVTRTTPFPTG